MEQQNFKKKMEKEISSLPLEKKNKEMLKMSYFILYRNA